MKPEWLKIKLNNGEIFKQTSNIIKELGITTVCNGASCPNKSDCWGNATATFMILGKTCTRNCKFCSVEKGKGEPIDETEPFRIAEAVKKLKLKYVVITSVDRDDLKDGGAEHFAKCVEEIKKIGAYIEVLIPDYKKESLEILFSSKLDVLGHNIETVKRLTPIVRDKNAGYEKSINVLFEAKKLNKKIKTKTSLMLGLGENRDEIKETMYDLRQVNVDILTIGQYLQPSKKQIEVVRYVEPVEFEELGKIAKEMGFISISGAFVRSSFKAYEMFKMAG